MYSNHCLQSNFLESAINNQVKGIKSEIKVVSSIIIINKRRKKAENESFCINNMPQRTADVEHDIRTFFCNNDLHNAGPYLERLMFG